MNARSALTPPALSSLAQSDLAATGYDGERLRLEERSAAALVRVHSLVDLPQECPDLAHWPERTGECRDGDPAVLCLAPREWLLLGSLPDAGMVLEGVHAAVDHSSTAVYDVSDGLALFRLTGAAAPWLLAKVCSLDLLAGRDGRAWCARTRVGHAAVILYVRDSAESAFDLAVDRSLARYLWELLVASAGHAEELAVAHGGAA